MPPIDSRRRFFLRGALRQTPAPLRPPWSLEDDAAFQSRCTRCNDCAAACPHRLIARGDGGYPVMNFAAHGCDQCGQCLRACASGALSPQAPAARWRARVQPQCLAQRQVECRSCAEVCEPRAIGFATAPGGIAQPRMDTAACTGCADCVSVCPANAIVMQN